MISDAFQARVVHAGPEGKAIDLGPDHYARLAAVGSLIRMMTGRPVPKTRDPQNGRRTTTVAEVEAELGVGIGAESRGYA